MSDPASAAYSPAHRRLLEILADPAAATLSTAELARRAGCSWDFAAKVRRWSGAASATVGGQEDRAVRPAWSRRRPPVLEPVPTSAAVAYGDGWRVAEADCLDWLRSLPERGVDLVFGSPPYLGARTYGRADVARGCLAWVAWMLDVTTLAARASRGLVIWIAAGETRAWQYQPGPEMLLAEWWRRGGACWRPAYWHRSGTPGAGGRQWLRPDVEYVLAFAGRGGPVPWADPLANGRPPTKNEGDYPRRHRRRGHGQRVVRAFKSPDVANPGTLVSIPAGGSLGSPLAKENEAPMPVDLARYFVRGWCPPGGTVADPFAGSGTTGATALELGRRFAGCDVRADQVALTARRLSEVVAAAVPKAAG